MPNLKLLMAIIIMNVETIINNVIRDLYELRKNLKQEKNPAKIVKLLMNSMYGKTIIKPVGTYTIVKDNRGDFEKNTSYNYNCIDSVIEVNGNFYIKKGLINLISFKLCQLWCWGFKHE